MDQFFAFTPQSWLSIFAVIFLLALAASAWRHRRVAGAIPFAIGCFFATLWAAGSVMEYAAVELATKIFWFKFQTVCQLPATTAITCFVLEYAWPGRWLTRRNLALLSIAPMLVLALTLTNDLHQLMWISFKFDQTVIPLLGSVAKFFIAYGFGLGIANLIVFGWLFVRSPQHRWPVAIMALGQILVRAFFVLDLAQVFQSDLPLDIIGIAFTYLMYIIALFGFRLFDPIPLAMQMVITQMPDGVVILDALGRVTDLNPAAQTILATSRKRVLGKPIQALLPTVADLVQNLLAAGAGQTEIFLETALGGHSYNLETSVIKDWRAVELGKLLFLRDITAQKQAHAQIVEQQRALAMLQERWRVARDLHDSLGQVIAFVNTQGQAVRRLLSQGDVPTADAQVARLVEAAREADVDIRESIMGLRVTLPEHGLFAALELYLAQYEKNYTIQTKLVKPEAFEADSLDPLVETQLLGILQEALTNVRKHAGARHVEVKFEVEPGWVKVTVKDDGQGFEISPQAEAAGEHFGLRVMRERAEEIGGSLRMHSEPGHGTQVRVRVPIK
jgi:signal transduction histidine kinase